MEGNNIEQEVIRSRSLRYEDYNNRRVFLRSYPLKWGEDEDQDQKTEKTTTDTNTRKEQKPVKKILISVIQWSEGKVLVLRRLKGKVAVCVVACIPVGFMSSVGLIST